MKFYTKSFLVAFGTSTLCSLGLCALIYTSSREHQKKIFVQTYESQLQIIQDTLLQLESAADLIALNAAQALREQERRSGLRSDSELALTAKGLNVAHIFATDRTGKFIRSTNGNVKDYKNTLFDYCAGYRDLVQGTAQVEQTPILPSEDEAVPGPFKYTMIPNFDRSRVLEVSIPLDFIGRTLGKAIHADPNVRELALYSPNGTPLGFVSTSGQAKPTSIDPQHIRLGMPAWGAKDVTFATQVKASTEKCCECAIKGVTGHDQKYYYLLKATVSLGQFNENLAVARNRIITLFLLMLAASAALSGKLSNLLLRRFRLIEQGVARIAISQDLSSPLNITGTDEVARLGKQIDEMALSLKKSQGLLLEAERSRTVAHLAAQLAHDIRSPLAALQVVESDLTELPEEKRLLLKTATNRIQDIANSLLKRHAAVRDNPPSFGASPVPTPTRSQEPQSVRLVASLLEAVLSEKRLQYRSRASVKIEFSSDESGAALFAQIQPIEFQRLLSNLINNSVEALSPSSSGDVRVLLARAGESLQIVVRDNGQGIPEAILTKLGQRGETYGKEGGSGLGLYHARTTIEAWGGTFELHSSVGIGTEVRILLPLVPPPAWFVARLQFAPKSTLVVLDDDPGIHQLWQTRFATLPLSDSGITIEHFSSPNEFRTWVQDHPGETLTTQFLVDSELRGSEATGLGLIEELALQDRSILVTSAFEDDAVLAECARLGVRLIPKSVAAFVPLECMSSSEPQSSGLRVHLLREEANLEPKAQGLSPSLI